MKQTIESNHDSFTPLRLAFKKHCWEYQESAELFKSIAVKQKEDLFLYNYRDAIYVEKTHPVVMKCRGIVLNKEGEILNLPFERFFNDFEEEKAQIDWGNAKIQEKVDGSLICVFWYQNHWDITTRGSFYPNKMADNDYSLLFKHLFKEFNLLDKSFCYAFELITTKNRIVTLYDYEAVYLIGMRHLTSLKEMSQEELDKEADILRVRRPRRFQAHNVDECRALFKDFRHDEEGLVVVDANFNRLKIKQESYFKLMRIQMLSDQAIFEYVIGKIQLDEEMINQLPEVNQKIKEIRQQWAAIQAKANTAFQQLEAITTRKEFAKEAFKYPYKALLFAKLDGKNIIERLQWEKVKTWVK